MPDLVIVCAGYDCLDSDELASVSLQASDFGRMSARLLEHLEQCFSSTSGESKEMRPAIVLGLEGGYQLSPLAGGGNLQDAVIETLRPLLR